MEDGNCWVKFDVNAGNYAIICPDVDNGTSRSDETISYQSGVTHYADSSESIGLPQSGVSGYTIQLQPAQEGGVEMFDTISLYMSLLPLLAWVFLCLGQLVYFLSLWVRDEPVGKVVFKGLAKLIISERDDCGWKDDLSSNKDELRFRVLGSCAFNGLLPVSFVWALGISGVIAIWMVSLPIAFIIIALFATRWAIRFKRKVNEAIEKCKPKKKAKAAK